MQWLPHTVSNTSLQDISEIQFYNIVMRIEPVEQIALARLVIFRSGEAPDAESNKLSLQMGNSMQHRKTGLR